MTFATILGPLALAAIWGATAGLAAAQGGEMKSLVPAFRLNEAEAKERGWTAKAFELGPPSVSFRSYVPADAEVETAAMTDDGPPPEGAAGKLKIVGKIRLAEADAPVEATLAVIRLAWPAAASRICAWGVEEDGHEIAAAVSSPDLAEAQTLGFRTKDGRRTGGVFLACFTRGASMLTIRVAFDLRGAATKEEAKRVTDATRGFAGGLLTNLTFADGRPSGYADDRMTEIEAPVGGDRLSFRVPRTWTPVINDFKGSLPAELHLERKVAGETRGLIWVSAISAPEAPDLENGAPKLLQDYVMAQSQDVERPTLTFSEEDPSFKATGVPSRSFRFSVKSKSGEDAGDVLAAVYWKDGRFYATSLWSRTPAADERIVFFSRLPGLTAYDLIRMELLRRLSSEVR